MKRKNIRGAKLNNQKYQQINQTNQTNQSNRTNQFIISIFILLIGIITGMTINLTGTFALDTASTSDATSTNSTSTNATPDSASPNNATSNNATSSNSTNSNAQKTDYVMYLNSLTLSTNKAKAGEKIYVNKSTTGACNTAMSITFVNKNNNTNFTVNVESINNNPYFVIPNYVASGDYEISHVLIIGLNSDNSTFSTSFKHSKYNKTDSGVIYDFNINLTIEETKVEKVELNNINFSNNSAKIGDKINLSLSTTEPLNSLKLIFKTNQGNEFTTYAANLNSNPYFIVPTNAKEGNYYLYQVTLITDTSSNVYTNGINYNFNINLEIKASETNTYIYNNNEITNDIIKNIYNGKDDLEVTINADDNSIISNELFNAIKGTKKRLIINYKGNQIIFCGNDIKTSKSIDVNITTNTVLDNAAIKKLIDDGIVINFASNGNLPGNALIKIKITNEMKNNLGNKKVYVYYFDEIDKKFSPIAQKISSKNGYYEFTITHNSKYVLTKTKIDNKLISTEDDNVVSFQQSNNRYLLWISAAIALIAIVVVIIIIIKKRNGKN